MPEAACVMFFGHSGNERQRDYAWVRRGMIFPFVDLLDRFHEQPELPRCKAVYLQPGRGALNPTDVETLWVHVTCTWFQPEVSFAGDEKMEPALGFLSIPSNSFVKVVLLYSHQSIVKSSSLLVITKILLLTISLTKNLSNIALL
ncbi:hypothetical protein V6N13_035538 [Hibiscus sabdariffa]|uniref:Uncharacterized protein n=1 Tax=Hibiscus sabdariffa TaxID=183260 RepID=A0ABR2S957_9ROSI